MMQRVKSALVPLWGRMPGGLRRRLVAAKLDARSRVRHRGVRVRIDDVYLGGTRGHTAREFAQGIEDPMWPTTRVVDGPHADLYRRFAEGNGVDDWRDPTIPYVDLALRCIDGFGEFCGCSNLDEVVDLIARRQSLWQRDEDAVEYPVDDPAVVRSIRGTSRFEVVDGHHRLARAWQRGVQHVLVDITWSTTPQDRVQANSDRP